MKGIDISRYQGQPDFLKVKADKVEFVIMKATQGNTWIDPQLSRNQKECRAKKLALGYYHFADGLDPVMEAQHFLKSVGTLMSGEILALDWEIAHSNPVQWCLAFLKEVEKIVGFKPMFYTNSARLYQYDWSPVVNNGNGLWVAQYGLNLCVATGSPRIGKWPFYAIWQYCSRGRVSGIVGNVDMNYTKMDVETLRKYGKPEEACNHCCPKHCG